MGQNQRCLYSKQYRKNVDLTGIYGLTTLTINDFVKKNRYIFKSMKLHKYVWHSKKTILQSKKICITTHLWFCCVGTFGFESFKYLCLYIPK
jgi:hypothetical protein